MLLLSLFFFYFLPFFSFLAVCNTNAVEQKSELDLDLLSLAYLT